MLARRGSFGLDAGARLGHTLLPKRIALPVFASDALSSVAYAPDEILLTLSMAGLSALVISPWVGLAVAIVMATGAPLPIPFALTMMSGLTS